MLHAYWWFGMLASCSLLCLTAGFANASTINNRRLDTLLCGTFWGINTAMLLTLGGLWL